MSVLLQARDVTKLFGGFRAVNGVSITVYEGEILGLIGPNGAGKSTLFNCLTGTLVPTSGDITFDGRDITRLPPEQRTHRGVARSFQVPQAFGNMTLKENVMVGAFARDHRVPDAAVKAQEVLDWVGLGARANAPAHTLGTPGRKRLEIARALATNPKLLLLDEAMAGLTPTEVRAAMELVRGIHHKGITLVVVEHIMEVIMSLTERVIVMHQGELIAQGSPVEIAGNQAVVDAYLGKRAARAARQHT